MNIKKRLRSLFVLVLGLGLLPLAFALTKQVSSVSGTASVVFTPGAQCQWVSIANTGLGAVMLSFDGTNPTATIGKPLAAGAEVVLVYAGSNQKQPIRAILQTGTTTTLNFTTADLNSQ